MRRVMNQSIFQFPTIEDKMEVEKDNIVHIIKTLQIRVIRDTNKVVKLLSKLEG